jgi:putative membrane protein
MRTLRENILLLAKGIGMGAADVVPGVSGGTVAFITGIYEELLDSIRSVNGKAFKLLATFDLKGFWKHINGNFLVVLFSGIAVSIISLSRVILFLLDRFPEMVWAFFFGLILASAWLVGKKITQWTAPVIIAGILGFALAFYITMASPTETPNDLWFIFLCGSIAICAMILPGISGSFILVLLAKYEYILSAVKDINVSVIIAFIGGCAVGILSFSHLLNWMLKKYHNLTVSLLTGFMLGSLNKVWPWKETLLTYTDRHGVLKPLKQQNILPTEYFDITGQDPHLAVSVVLALAGFIMVYALERFSERKEKAVKVKA